MTTSRTSRLTQLVSSIALMAIASGAMITLPSQAAVAVDLSRRVAFDIPAQPLPSALMQFSSQAGVEFSASTDLVEGKQVSALKGTYATQEALAMLLAGTGLEFAPIDDRVLAIRAKGDASAGGRDSSGTSQATKEESPGSFGRLRLAQNGQTSRTDSSSESSQERIAEVVVTGSRLRRRSGDEASPVPITVFDRHRLDELGVASVAGVLNYLPQQPSADFDSARFPNGASFAQLRGVGLDKTLVLINGRRAVPSGSSVAFNAFDLNTIPLTAVERIEVLSDSASAIYGADAVGGVINITLKRRISSPTIEMRYGTADGGARERRVSLSAGLANERLRAAAVADYFDVGILPATERDLSADKDYRRFGSIDRRSLRSNPGNVCSADGGNLPGLTSPCAAIPQGSTGVGLTPADFSATDGQQNFQHVSGLSSIIGPREGSSALLFAELDLSPGLTVFADLLYVDRNNGARGNAAGSITPSSARLTVPAANPFNPFGTAVRVDYLFSGVGRRYTEVNSESFRGAVGLKGGFGTWDWEVSVLGTDEKSKSESGNFADLAAANAALNETDPALALNVFQDGSAGSPQLLASLRRPPTFDSARSRATQGGGFIRGGVFSLPAGRVEAVVGAEVRSEKANFQQTDGGFPGDRNTSAAFAEMRFPLIGVDMRIPAVRTLDLTVAGRYDHYNDFGDTFNPQYGLVWSPIDDLALRLAYSESFQAPALFELYLPRSEFAGRVSDPRRNDETVDIVQFAGGNPDLEPLEASSLTAGFVFSPRNLPGLRISASYWQLDLSNRFGSLVPDLLVAFEHLFPGRVARAASTPADIAAGLPGQIQSVESTILNFGTLETSGIDLGLAQSIDALGGRFTLSLSGTWIERYRTLNAPGTPIEDFVGTTNDFLGALPLWRAIGTLGWTRRGVGLSATANYMAAYDDATFDGPTGRVIPAQTLMDVQGSIRFNEFMAQPPALLNGISLTAGVLNLLDRQPSFAEVRGVIGYDTSQGNIRGRFGYLSLSKSF